MKHIRLNPNKRTWAAFAIVTAVLGITAVATCTTDNNHSHQKTTTSQKAKTSHRSSKQSSSKPDEQNSQSAASDKSQPQVVKQETAASEKSTSQPTNQTADQATSQAASQSSTSTDANETTPVQAVQSQAPATASDVSYGGQGFNLASFSGVHGESTPQWTNNVFKWTAASNYYLAEQASAAGIATHSLTIGSPITIEGHTYHVSSIDRSWPRANSNYVFNKMEQHAIGLQTCAESTGTYINIYWAD